MDQTSRAAAPTTTHKPAADLCAPAPVCPEQATRPQGGASPRPSISTPALWASLAAQTGTMPAQVQVCHCALGILLVSVLRPGCALRCFMRAPGLQLSQVCSSSAQAATSPARPARSRAIPPATQWEVGGAAGGCAGVVGGREQGQCLLPLQHTRLLLPSPHPVRLATPAAVPTACHRTPSWRSRRRRHRRRPPPLALQSASRHFTRTAASCSVRPTASA